MNQACLRASLDLLLNGSLNYLTSTACNLSYASPASWASQLPCYPWVFLPSFSCSSLRASSGTLGLSSYPSLAGIPGLSTQMA